MIFSGNVPWFNYTFFGIQLPVLETKFTILFGTFISQGHYNKLRRNTQINPRKDEKVCEASDFSVVLRFMLTLYQALDSGFPIFRPTQIYANSGN